MFIFNLFYVKSLQDVEKFLPEHIAYLEKNYASGNFICSGRKTPRTGGVILGNFENMEKANVVLKQDPFFINGIAKYEIIEFTPTKYSAEFSKIINLE